MIYIILCSLIPLLIFFLRQLDKIIAKILKFALADVYAHTVSFCLICTGLYFLKVNVAIIAAISLGSICFGVILAKIFNFGDISKQGSGNVGATNMARIGGVHLGAITLILDASKGFFMVNYFMSYSGFDMIEYLISALKMKGWCVDFINFVLPNNTMDYGSFTYLPGKRGWFFGLVAVLLHMMPIFSRVKGGKGVAVFFGALIACESTNITLITFGVWIIAFLLWHISSISALLSVLLLALYKLALAFLLQAKVYININEESVYRFEVHVLSSTLNFWPFFILTLSILLAHRSNIIRILCGREPRFFMKAEK